MGVELPSYRTVEAHGSTLEVFDCEPQEAALTRRGCASRWDRAQAARKRRGEDSEAHDALGACRTCPIGALHAGKDPTISSPDYGSDQCPRCGFGTTRMVGNRICVSCYNRETEFLKGRNARGNKPAAFPGLVDMPMVLVIDGRIDRTARRVAVAHRVRGQVRGGPAEAMLQTIRTTRGLSISFGWRGNRAWQAQQLELFA